MPVVMSRMSAEEALASARIPDVIAVRLLVVGSEGRVLDMDSTDYAERVGRNTGYVIHPDEVLADNFSLLVRQRLGAQRELEHPGIITGLAATLASLAAPTAP